MVDKLPNNSSNEEMPNDKYISEKYRRKIYDITDPYIFWLKALLQMLIGLGIIVLLSGKILHNFTDIHPIIAKLTQKKSLEIVADGLAYAAGIELAYMLFTPGPDEAIEPVILALASALILSISRVETLNLNSATALVVFALGLGLLFFIRAIFVKPHNFPKPGKWLSRIIKIIQDQNKDA